MVSGNFKKNLLPADWYWHLIGGSPSPQILDKDDASKNLEGLHIGVPMAWNLKVQDVDIIV